MDSVRKVTEIGNEYRNLLPQKLQILITIRQTQLRRGQLLRQHGLRLFNGISQHDIRPKPKIHLLRVRRVDRRTRVECIVQFEVRLQRVGVIIAAHLQKLDHFQRLFDIRDLFTEARRPSLCVYFHKLVFGDHLLEGAERGLDVCARRDVVGYIVDEGSDGDTARVSLGVYCSEFSAVG